MNETKPTKLLTIPLVEFLDLQIGYEGYVELSYKIAFVISKVDEDESLTHVEFKDITSGKELAHPKVWRKKEWLKYDERIRVKKLQNEKENRIIEQNKQNIYALADLIASKTKMKREDLLTLASDMYRSGDFAFLKAIGANIKDVEEVMDVKFSGNIIHYTHKKE